MIRKNGFTIVESLVVTVILLVVLFLCGYAGISSLKKAHKEVFKREIIRVMQAGSSAYQMDLLNKEITSGSSKCYSLDWLEDNNYFMIMAKNNNYKGSVLVEPLNDGKNLTYHVWLANDNFYVNNASLANLDDNLNGNEDGVIVYESGYDISLNCGN